MVYAPEGRLEDLPLDSGGKLWLRFRLRLHNGGVDYLLGLGLWDRGEGGGTGLLDFLLTRMGTTNRPGMELIGDGI